MQLGIYFYQQMKVKREFCIKKTESIIKEENQICLGWREVPVNPEGANVGPAAKGAQPHIKQLFIQCSEGISQDEFDRKLYLIRKRISNLIRNSEELKEAKLFLYMQLVNYNNGL